LNKKIQLKFVFIIFIYFSKVEEVILNSVIIKTLYSNNEIKVQ